MESLLRGELSPRTSTPESTIRVRTALATSAARAATTRIAAASRRLADSNLASRLVACGALGRFHLYDVHRSIFLGAYQLDHRADSAVAFSVDHGRPVRFHPPHRSEERPLYRILYFLLAAVSSRARRTERVALVLGPHGPGDRRVLRVPRR